MYPSLIKALEYARAHGTTMSQTAEAIGVSPNALANYVTIARRKGEVVEFPKAPRKTSTPRVSPHLQRALEYSQRHGTTMTEAARALGIDTNALNCAVARARKAGLPVEWGAAHRAKPEQAKPAPRPAADPSDVPLDLIRHVRNGTAFWEQRPAPIGAVRRGPSPPVPPAPSNAAERHHTAAGIAWRLDVAPGEVERLRVMLGLPVYMTDIEADAIIRLLNPRTAPAPPCTHTPPAHP
jgi:transposase-like protein